MVTVVPPPGGQSTRMRTLMGFDEAFHGGESQTGPARFRGHERREELVADLRGNAGTGVGDGDPAAPFSAGDVDPDVAAALASPGRR